MNTLKVAGTLLLANEEERTLQYTLLPFEEEGQTSLGKVTASRGSVTIPEDVSQVTLNLEHDYKKPVGRAVDIHEEDNAIVATFKLANTHTASELLAEATEGLRSGVSVELGNVVIRAGKLISSVLQAAGAVVRPAFPSALLVAEDCGELEASLEQPEEEETISIKEEESIMDNTTAVPTALAAESTPAVELTAENVAKVFATRDQKLAAELTPGETGLFASLSEITSTANTGNVTTSQWLGRLWQGKTYSRRYVPLISSKPLTSWKIEGWTLTTGPTISAYDGDLSEIASTATATSAYSVEATRLAGGWKIDRKYADFGDTEFVNSVYSAAVEDYALKSDLQALSAIKTAAAANQITGGTVPTGVNAGVARIVDGALKLIEDNVGVPTFALVSATIYRDILLSRQDDALEYITSALGLEEGSLNGFALVPVADTLIGGASEVIVGRKEGLIYCELPGVPVRAESIDLSHGGFDHALFGYSAVVVNNASAIVSVAAA